MADMQNPGVQAGASRNQLVGWLPHSVSAQTQQRQTLCSRFVLSESLAKELARLAYGETAND